MSAGSPDRPRPAAARPIRVSQQRYLGRRLMALVVVALVVAGGIKIADALFGSDETRASGDQPGSSESLSETTAESGSDSSAVVVEPSSGSTPAQVTDPADTAGVTADAPETSGQPVVPSAATPAKVLIAGDSDAGTFGPYLVTLLDQTGVVDTTLDYKVSSGLARPDFFDWPSHFRQQIANEDPDIVVVTFGGNDAQGLSNPAGTFVVGQPSGTVADGESGESDPKWREEYGRRVGEVMDFLAADGRTLIWVGIPNDDQDSFTQRLAVQNEVVKAQVATHPGVVFVDTWARFAGRDGNWAEYVIDPRDGQGKDVRAADGFHLNENGAEILALDILEAIRAELRARGAIL